MRKLLILVLLLLSLPAYAQKSEWIDGAYDFSKAKRIYVSYFVVPELCDGIVEKETSDWFFKQVKKELVDKIPKGIKVESQYKAEEKILAETGISLENRSNESPEDAKKFLDKYLQENYDLIVEAKFLESAKGKKHFSGYTYTTTVPKTTRVLGSNGQFTTVMTSEQQVHTVPAGDLPTSTIALRVDVIDTTTSKPVWSLTDRREKEGELWEDSVNPKGMFHRIVADFCSHFRKALKGEMKKPEIKDVGF